MANASLFLFILVLFKHKIYRKTVGFSGIWTWIVGVEGKYADHLTTTTVLALNIRLMELLAFNCCTIVLLFEKTGNDLQIN